MRRIRRPTSSMSSSDSCNTFLTSYHYLPFWDIVVRVASHRGIHCPCLLSVATNQPPSSIRPTAPLARVSCSLFNRVSTLVPPLALHILVSSGSGKLTSTPLGHPLASPPLRVVLHKLGIQLRSRRRNRTRLARPTSSLPDSLSMPASSPLFSNGLMRPPHAHHPHQRSFPRRRKWTKWTMTWPPPPPHPLIATVILSKPFKKSSTRSPTPEDLPTSLRSSLQKCMTSGTCTLRSLQRISRLLSTVSYLLCWTCSDRTLHLPIPLPTPLRQLFQRWKLRQLFERQRSRPSARRSRHPRPPLLSPIPLPLLTVKPKAVALESRPAPQDAPPVSVAKARPRRRRATHTTRGLTRKGIYLTPPAGSTCNVASFTPEVINSLNSLIGSDLQAKGLDLLTAHESGGGIFIDATRTPTSAETGFVALCSNTFAVFSLPLMVRAPLIPSTRHPPVSSSCLMSLLLPALLQNGPTSLARRSIARWEDHPRQPQTSSVHHACVPPF
jgi:hypothetical protein